MYLRYRDNDSSTIIRRLFCTRMAYTLPHVEWRTSVYSPCRTLSAQVTRSSFRFLRWRGAPVPAMPLQSEMVHPKGFSFRAQKQIVLLRDVKELTWPQIADQVRTLQNEKPGEKLRREYYKKFNAKLGRVKTNYHKCGPKPLKVDKAVKDFLVSKLVALRRQGPCTSTMLQLELAREKNVKLTPRYIRKILVVAGYKWLPRRQKRIYSKAEKEQRLKFAKHVVSLSKAQLREKLSFAMDGVILAMPPTDPTARINFCRAGEPRMWRKPSEAFIPQLSGADDYGSQVPLSRALPLWGGLSEGGFAAVLFHKTKKVKQDEWARAVKNGKLVQAIKALKPVKPRGPWNVVCDNEAFLRTKVCSQAHKAVQVKLWNIPAKSPDLNPVERFWGWLRRKLKAMDLADALKKRRVLGKSAYAGRVRRVLKTRKAQSVAASFGKSFKSTCRIVVAKKGAHSGK